MTRVFGAVFVMLAMGCGASSADVTATPSSESPVRGISDSPQTAATTPGFPPRTHVLRTHSVRNALRGENITGYAIVPRSAILYSSRESASAAKVSERLAAKTPRRGYHALRVVHDHGDLVEIETISHKNDCVNQRRYDSRSPTGDYVIRVFVHRDELVPRVTKSLHKVFKDGSGYVVDVGAPLYLGPGRTGWNSWLSAQSDVAIPPRAIGYGVQPVSARKRLPSQGERLLCSQDRPPVPESQWRRSHRDAQPWEAPESCRIFPTVQYHRAPPARTQAKTKGRSQYKTREYDFESSAVELPRQSIASPAAPQPRLNGRNVAVSEFRTASEQTVHRLGGNEYVDVHQGCFHTRLRVAITSIGAGGSGAGVGSIWRDKTRWTVTKGPVFWTNGTPAGRYTGRHKVLTDMTSHGDYWCHKVHTVDSQVCHPKRDVKVSTPGAQRKAKLK